MKIIKSVLFSIAILAGLGVWFLVDWHSPKNWIAVTPITNASIQTKGESGFLLPAGEYAIVVTAKDEAAKDQKIEIHYFLEVSSEKIHIESKKVVNIWFVGSFIQETISVKKDRAEGQLKIKILSPVRGTVSIGLMSNRFAGM